MAERTTRTEKRVGVREPGGEGLARALLVLGRKQGRAFWRFFTSVRLALILILFLGLLTLIGTLVIQAPSDALADPEEYAWWLDNVARAKLGVWATPFNILGLLDVFHSAWFLGAGSLLMLNIVICSLNRWKTIKSAIGVQKVRLADGFYERGVNRIHVPNVGMTHEEAAAVVGQVLAGKGYRVLREDSPDAAYIVGDKNRYFLLSTYLHHWSVVLLVLGFVLGSYLGFRNQSFAVPEGSERDVGNGTGLSLELESFVDEYWPEGPPKDYRSEVVLYDNGVEVQRGIIRVNHRMEYRGVRFYQSFFGPAAVMEVRDLDGNILYQDGVAQGWLSGEDPYKRPTGRFSIPGTGITAYVVSPAQGYYDPWIKAGQMRVEVYQGSSRIPIAMETLEPGVPAELAGLEFTFVRERQFSGFQVTRDPGNALIWIASGLFVLGLVLFFYFPHRRVWARVHKGQDGRTRLSMRGSSTRSFAVASDFQIVADRLERELSMRDGTG